MSATETDTDTERMMGLDNTNTNSLSNVAQVPLNATDYPPGTIAVPCGDLARYTQFTQCMATLNYPAGTQVSMAKSLSIAQNLNTIIRGATGDWVWFLGDDHSFDPNLLLRLLDRLYDPGNPLDIVTPLCLRRTAPFAPVTFKERKGDVHTPFAYDELPSRALFEVVAAGTAGMLVRKAVFDTLGDPWFVNAHTEAATEDLEFCRRIREAGYSIWCDSANLLGHIGQFTIWPKRSETGDWGILLDFGPGPSGAANQLFVNVAARERAEGEAEERISGTA